MQKIELWHLIEYLIDTKFNNIKISRIYLNTDKSKFTNNYLRYSCRIDIECQNVGWPYWKLYICDEKLYLTRSDDAKLPSLFKIDYIDLISPDSYDELLSILRKMNCSVF